jgi:hypothetical protein
MKSHSSEGTTIPAAARRDMLVLALLFACMLVWLLLMSDYVALLLGGDPVVIDAPRSADEL